MTIIIPTTNIWGFPEKEGEKVLFPQRVEQLRNFITNEGAEGLLISRCDNFSWFTFGGRNHITLNSVEGVASILLTREKIYLFVDNIEKERLRKEEIAPEIWKELEVIEYDWWKSERTAIMPFLEDKKILSDTGRYGTINVASKIDPFRYVLTKPEIETYRELGRICDHIMNREIRKLSPDVTELEVQGRFYHSLAAEGIEPLLTIVFGDESALLYRHNLSRKVPLGKKAFVSICARKKGLVLSCTRSIMFEKNKKYIKQHLDNCYVDAVAIANSIPGTKLSQLSDMLKQAYAKVGKPEEWKLHHQGGLAGYNPRELIATKDIDYPLRPGNVVAWNPTITGTKSEDTILVGENDVELLSYPEKSEWPSLTFEIYGKVIRRPNILLL
ncbi:MULTISPECIES: Xaa-Pro peptidase family protein [Kosmotoga]|uniref:Peptidase M24 n=1 Tax=Kosmotoga olearia (strain ATCC BAA-1733 / DSM 21960 / TBF 19.5.1) TaxID=521045 RepID=C5CH20_KOSOT|nr:MULTISPECIES: M24 family metallopeptidase [Kosmotoga]ACR79685.1 peptidase M24 [Kosmotoga olearia TBF 19.5.1]